MTDTNSPPQNQEPLWRPSAVSIASSNLTRYLGWLEQTYLNAGTLTFSGLAPVPT